MKIKRSIIGRTVAIAQGKVINKTIIYDGSPLDDDLSDTMFEEKYHMTKAEYMQLCKRYMVDDDPDSVMCISTKESEIIKQYQNKFGQELPLDDHSFEQREYVFRQGKMAVEGKRDIITTDELLRWKR